jgi:hypothetical protein
MTMSNPDYLGEYSKLYYQLAEVDMADPEDDILADSSWVELCVVDVSVTRARTLREVVDRCVGDDKEYTGGKRDTGITVNLNELRLTPAIVRAWNVISDTTGIIALLILNGDRDAASLGASTDSRGLTGNFIVEQDDDSQPSEGNNTNSLTFKPAARAASVPKVKRVYGSSIT